MKALYVATVVKTHIMEFHVPYLKMLKEMGWETSVAAKNDYDDPTDCVIPYCDNYIDISFERTPFSFKNINAYKQLKRIIDSNHFDIIHCHTPVGAMITRLAANKSRKKGTKVIYTAHGFHFYKGAPLINWILYYPAERFLARMTDVLITINREDYKRAQRFKAGSVEYVPGIGIDLSKFIRNDHSQNAFLKDELGIPQNAKVLLSVGEVNKNKNHRIVIEALSKMEEQLWYVICGTGPLIEELKSLSKQLGISNRVIFAGYRTDVLAFYNIADLFVFPSLREGLPVALMEAMSTKLVCVAARNRGTDDLLNNSRLLFYPTDVSELVDKIKLAIHSDCSDEVTRNYNHLCKFDLNNTLELVKNIYKCEVLNKQSNSQDVMK